MIVDPRASVVAALLLTSVCFSPLLVPSLNSVPRVGQLQVHYTGRLAAHLCVTLPAQRR